MIDRKIKSLDPRSSAVYSEQILSSNQMNQQRRTCLKSGQTKSVYLRFKIRCLLALE